MMWNPYEVLGIPSTASDEEIKKAYRKLSRIYHPDANMNKSDAEKRRAEEKFKEVQDAYNQIMKLKEQGGNHDGFGTFYGQRSTNHRYDSNQDSLEMNAAANYLNSGYYREALNVLNRISNRTARWYYYSAVANYGLGSNANAMNLARKALEMEPGNREYAEFLDRLQYRSQWYRTMGQGYGRPMMDRSSICYTLCLANLLCNCCCRPI